MTHVARNLATWALIAALSALSAFHLGMTWLYNSPDNYVKIMYDRQLSEYFHGLFFQNWSFFAPNPMDMNITLLARGRLSDGRVTAWVDVTDPILRSMQRNRFSAYEFIATSLMNASLDGRNVFLEYRKKNKQGYSLYEVPQFRPLYRTGASILMNRFTGKRFAAVQVGLQQTTYPRFTDRMQAGGKSPAYVFLLDWHPFPYDVDSTAW